MVPNISCEYVRKIDRTTRNSRHQPLLVRSYAVVHVPHADSVTYPPIVSRRCKLTLLYFVEPHRGLMFFLHSDVVRVLLKRKA